MAKIDGRTLAHKTLEHLRIISVKRVVEDGEKPSVVMDSLGLCRTSIYPWLREFKDKGLEALAEKISAGPEPLLNKKQREQVRRWIVGKDPRPHGFDFGLWTRRIVHMMIQEKMGVGLCLTSVGKLLASLDSTPQKPLRRAYERDPAAVELWQKEVYPKLKKPAKRLGAMIFFLDEAGFQSDPPLGRTYGLKGHPPVVASSGQRQSLNVISAVNASGAFWSATDTGKLNAESLVEFLKNFMKGQRQKVMLVVDGHPAHKANLVKAYMAKLAGRLELSFLPPYSPDLNPDEFVWNYMKETGVSKRPLKKNESLRDRVEQDLIALHQDKVLVASFFLGSSGISGVYFIGWKRGQCAEGLANIGRSEFRPFDRRAARAGARRSPPCSFYFGSLRCRNARKTQCWRAFHGVVRPLRSSSGGRCTIADQPIKHPPLIPEEPLFG